ncbi:uncharacterized protein LOC115941155 [Leptonychotes weddellii]|uniref:Uncharacterized protein LOC115941155 n=1 Tax=Leptonychotes weddellii TaxID=9713 RepID=A0A7F8QUZ5_LEPWE|nr:uncharacterized protein LOC115941155 [Leptonychotes weddellii]
MQPEERTKISRDKSSSGRERGEKRSAAIYPGALQAPRPQAGGCTGGPGDRSRALTRRDPVPSPQPSTGQAQTVKQPRGSPHPHLGADGGGISERRPRRLPAPLAQLCGPCAQPPPSQRARGAFGRRVWWGEKNGGHSNAADGRWGLRGPEKAGLRGRKLDHPWALEPHRSGPWDDLSVPIGQNLTFSGEQWTEALTGPEGERSPGRRRAERLTGHRRLVLVLPDVDFGRSKWENYVPHLANRKTTLWEDLLAVFRRPVYII